MYSRYYRMLSTESIWRRPIQLMPPIHALLYQCCVPNQNWKRCGPIEYTGMQMRHR